MKIVIPMAGKGQRFVDQSDANKEYLVPKPMIKVFDKPMVKWAIESYSSFLQQNKTDTEKLVKTSDLVFICLAEHEEQNQISDFLKNEFSDDINIRFAEQLTRGPAETALLAADIIDSGEDVIISDCDHHFDASALWNAICMPDESDNVLGILPIIQPEDTEPSWSYVVLNERKEVIDIREKDEELARQLAYGVIGAYYFRKGRYFVQEAKDMIAEGDLVGGAAKTEFYMSRIYQRMIERNFTVKSVKIKDGWLLGTPKHFNRFIESYQVEV